MSAKPHETDIVATVFVGRDMADILRDVASWLDEHPHRHLWDISAGTETDDDGEHVVTAYCWISETNMQLEKVKEALRANSSDSQGPRRRRGPSVARR